MRFYRLSRSPYTEDSPSSNMKTNNIEINNRGRQLATPAILSWGRHHICVHC